jgi:flagellar FliJ protein
MAVKSSIPILIELTKRKSDKAAIQLSQSNADYKEALEKFALLEDYRNHYGEQLEIKMSLGLNISSYNNYQTFLSNLNKAVMQQQLVVRTNLQIVEKYRNEWLLYEKERLSFNTLNNRTQLAIRINENKTEQKQYDELSSRAQQVKL